MPCACNVCEKLTTTKCGGCRRTYYCSTEHQKQDWKNHERLCSEFQITRKAAEIYARKACVIVDTWSKTEIIHRSRLQIMGLPNKTHENLYAITIFGKFQGKFATISYFATQKADVFTQMILKALAKDKTKAREVFVFLNAEVSKYSLKQDQYVDEKTDSLCHALFKGLTRINVIIHRQSEIGVQQATGSLTESAFEFVEVLFAKYLR